MDRRSFLTRMGRAMAGATLGAPALGWALSGCKLKAPLKSERHRAVIIGSGFGGAIAAYHLSQAGVETVVLERGRRWPIRADGNTFPRFFHPDRRSAWFSRTPTFPNSPPAVFKPYAGLIERVNGDGMNVICGAAVGGGSVVYGGMMLKPPRELFYRVFPDDIDYDELDRVYYPRVKENIGLGKIPDDILDSERYKSTRLYFEHAAKAGLHAEKIYDAVSWDIVRDEIEGKAVASASVGESIYGINSGAKNSVDRNYLAWAEQTGRVQVYPLHIVSDIVQDAKGRGYVVACQEIDEDGNVLFEKLISCDYLFMAAGSAGTSRLLVKAKATKTLTNLNDEVGKGWGNNGDRLVLRIGLKETTLPKQGAPASAAIFDPENPLGPVTLEHGPGPMPIEMHAMPILGMGIPESRGEFYYDKASGEARLRWPLRGDQGSVTAIMSTLDRLNQASGGSTFDFNWLNEPSTYHPLGGMVIGKACDWYGRVKGHERLYVVDSSLIPGSAACCNPAWTVAAFAERCMDRIVAEDFD